MVRNKGTFNFSANFEVLAKAPLDARMLAPTYASLIDPSTWADNVTGGIWLFDGAIVSVANDPTPSLNGIYYLNDANNFTNYNSWEKAGADVSIGVINVGEPSSASTVGIFAGYDASGNIQLRKLGGAGGITITENLNNIWISTDVSYSGQANFGENINLGVTDISIYQGMNGDALAFRTLSAGANISLVSSSDNRIIIDTLGGGSGVNGGVFITSINPTGSGNVVDVSTSSAGQVIESIQTDTQLVTVSLLALTGHTNYYPNVFLNGIPVPVTPSVDKPMFTGSLAIDLNNDSSIVATHEDGASHKVDVTYETIPQVLDASMTGGYPGSQTELKAGDTFLINVLTDVSVSSIYLYSESGLAFDASTYDVTPGTVHQITGVIANRGNVVQDLGFKLRVTKSTGSTSADYLSTDHGTTDGVYRVKCNNVAPSIVFGSIAYPLNQQAIKSGESALVNNTVSNYSSISYSSPTGELTIASPVAYQSPKTVTYLSGGYNISTPNLTISAFRQANGSSSQASINVKIANTPATIYVTNPAARFRSGGNDGTTIQSHPITITGNQQLLGGAYAPTLQSDIGGGAWQTSPTFSGGPTSWTNNLMVHDNDIKGVYNWGAISAYNLAGIQTTTTTGGVSNYTLGGFVSRNLTVPAFGTGGTIHVDVTDINKMNSTLNWSVKDLDLRQPIGTPAPVVRGWTINADGIQSSLPKLTDIIILDTATTGSSSQESNIINIAEAI